MPATRTALVVHESMFGNTGRVARAVARGLEAGGLTVSLAGIHDVSVSAVTTADLLVLGAPTHAFSLSRANTRADAIRQGAPAQPTTTGMREWLDTLPHAGPGQLAAVFDTRVDKVRRLPMNAARKLAKELKGRGYRLVAAPQGFLVHDTPGPLLEGEEERALAWGSALATEVAARAGTTA